MNPITSRLVFVLAAACATPAFSASNLPLDPDALVQLSDRCCIERGMHRTGVAAMFGAPSARLSADVWVYFDFKAKRRPTGETYDTLVIEFADDRVSTLKLTAAAPVRAFLARQQAAKAGTIARN